ncbi:MAG: Uma2 family endonuclease [bacterium]
MATVTAESQSASLFDSIPFDLTVEIYERMIEAGLIPPDRRLYLQSGRLFEKMAKTKAHGSVGAGLNMALSKSLPAGWSIWPESTLLIDSHNAPLPDFSVLKSGDMLGKASPDHFPGPQDVGMLVEIAVTSLASDLTSVLELYARALIPVYWVVDVPGMRILVFYEPRLVEGRCEFARRDIFLPGQLIPLILEGHEVAKIPFDDILRS